MEVIDEKLIFTVFSSFIGVYVFIGVILTVTLIFVNGILVEG